MGKENIFWIEGFTSPSTRTIADEVIKKIEKEIGEEIEKIEYVNFINKNVKKLKESLRIIEYAKKIAQELLSNSINSDKYPIIIGCSMGGLIARHLVEKMGLEVRGLILLATPNKGIRLSLPERIFLKIIGPVLCVEDMKPGSDFLKSLEDPPLEECYYFFGGINDSRVNIGSSLPIKGSRSILVNARHKDTADAEAIMKVVSIIKTLILTT